MLQSIQRMYWRFVIRNSFPEFPDWTFQLLTPKSTWHVRNILDFDVLFCFVDVVLSTCSKERVPPRTCPTTSGALLETQKYFSWSIFLRVNQVKTYGNVTKGNCPHCFQQRQAHAGKWCDHTTCRSTGKSSVFHEAVIVHHEWPVTTRHNPFQPAKQLCQICHQLCQNLTWYLTFLLFFCFSELTSLLRKWLRTSSVREECISTMAWISSSCARQSFIFEQECSRACGANALTNCEVLIALWPIS